MLSRTTHAAIERRQLYARHRLVRVNVLLLLLPLQHEYATGHSAAMAVRIFLDRCGISKIAYLSSIGHHSGLTCGPVRQLLE
jgi:hypothetical protein